MAASRWRKPLRPSAAARLAKWPATTTDAAGKATASPASHQEQKARQSEM